MTVNASHLILLELCFELSNPNLYGGSFDHNENENFNEIFESSNSELVPEPTSARLSHKTTDASRVQNN